MTGAWLAAVLAATAALLWSGPPRLRPVGVAPPSAPTLRRGASPPSVPVLVGVAVGVAVAVFVGGWLGMVLGLGAGLGARMWMSRVESPAARRRREAIEQALPLAVDLLASCLAVGQAPSKALQEVASVLDGPLTDELAAISARLRLGTDPVTVWRDVASHPQLAVWGRTVLRAVDSGASVAEALSSHAEDLRRESGAQIEARARSVGVRAALPLGVCLLPAFVLLGVVPLVAGSMSIITLR